MKSLILQITSQTLRSIPLIPLQGDEYFIPDLLKLMHLHFLGSRFWRIFREAGFLSQCSNTITEKIKQESYHIQRIHALAEYHLPNLVKKLNQENLNPVILKGWFFANRFYERPDERFFTDYDLLFPQNESEKVFNFFIENGYKVDPQYNKFNANNWKKEFILPSDPLIKIECHFGLGYNQFKMDHCFNTLSYQTFSLDDENKVDLFHLSPDNEFLYLIFHGAIQHRFQKLIWLLDLAQMLKKDVVDIENVLHQSSQYHLTNALHCTLYFLSRFCGVGPAVKIRPRLDQWFSKIVSFEIESSLYNRLALRSIFYQDGFIGTLKYATQHLLSHSKSKKNLDL